MGLFDKKYCDICGDQIKFLGNKKLEDGNCCKDCVSKLSPWFNERRHSTVESIKEQLEYREANKAEVEKFNVTRTIGEGSTKVLVDEDQKKFLVCRTSKWRNENPDVIPFSAVTGCETKVDESRYEEKTTDKDGNRVSYRPPHFTYTYSFDVELYINNPYFDEIRFSPCSSVSEKVVGPMHRHGAEYDFAVQSLAEIKEIFTGIRENTRAEATAAAQPKVPVKCPSCGATTIPNESGCCDYCGSPLN